MLKPDQQTSLTVASKLLADDLTAFMDRVAERLDLYEPKIKAEPKHFSSPKKPEPVEMPLVVEPRERKHY